MNNNEINENPAIEQDCCYAGLWMVKTKNYYGKHTN